MQQRRARNPLPTTTAPPPPCGPPPRPSPSTDRTKKKKKKRKNKKDGPLCLDSTSPRGEPDPAVPGECGGLARLRHRGRPPYSRDGGGGGRRGTAGGGAVPTAVGSLSHPSDPHPPAPTTALPKWTRGPRLHRRQRRAPTPTPTACGGWWRGRGGVRNGQRSRAGCVGAHRLWHWRGVGWTVGIGARGGRGPPLLASWLCRGGGMGAVRLQTTLLVVPEQVPVGWDGRVARARSSDVRRRGRRRHWRCKQGVGVRGILATGEEPGAGGHRMANERSRTWEACGFCPARGGTVSNGYLTRTMEITSIRLGQTE